MAEQPGRSASAAVTGGDSQEESPHEKLQRLEMLLVKIHSTVEVSAKHAVENTWLVQCRDALKEAASEGDEVLAFFRQRAMDTRATGSSSELYDAASSGAALFFTGNALSGVEQGIRDRANSLFSGDEDTERLNVAVETLQQLSPDVAEVIRLLQLEILPKIEQSWPATRKRPLPPLLLLPQDVRRRPQNPATRARLMIPQRRLAPEGRLGRIKEAIQDEIRSEVYGVAPRRRPMEEWIADTPEYRDYQAWVALLRRLSPLLAGGRIGWAVQMMLDRDMEGRGALAMWASVLREAKRQGCAVLLDTYRYLRRYTHFDDDETPAQRAHGRERDEVHRLVRSLEMLAGDAECFGGLVALCPWELGHHHPLTSSPW
jgi:hypothetical protein